MRVNGVTLLELVVGIVILGIAVTSAFVSMRSYMGQQSSITNYIQASYYARMYMDEILGKSFSYYDSTSGNNVICPTHTPVSSDDRSAYEWICAYQGITNFPVTRIDGTNPSANYSVTVTITYDSTVTLGASINGASVIAGTNNDASKIIQIQVSIYYNSGSTPLSTLIAYATTY